ncbi:MAG TPA: GTPase Era [Pseudobacteroides sp.]|uniref:GTPase Era n=1 Tax=Pseudobacteroides sp. TaxID=1968840 RepID=UPI002F9449BE
MKFKSGFVTIVGRPNVGKSTLLNRLTGEKIAITSDKPQTTRNAIRAIITDENSQIIFIDTPGIHKPKNKLGEFMVNIAQGTIRTVEAVIFIAEAGSDDIGPGDMYIMEQLGDIKTPVFLVINKIDLVPKEKLLSIIASYSEKLDFYSVIPVSALNNEGTDIVLKEIKKVLPEGPMYYPDDQITDQPEKQICAEIIREKILYLTKDEVPHGTGVDIISFKERAGKDIIDIQANIYCEKDSHKGILIGKEGKMLKKIGMLARKDIEDFLGTKVFLEVWVKVKDDWRNSNNMLKTLGYKEND